MLAHKSFNLPLLSLALFVCGSLLLPTQSFAMDGICRKLFVQKKFEPAAKCFQKLVKNIDKQKQFASMATLLKDRFSRDAAISYNSAADTKKEIAKRGYLKEKAIQILQRTQENGYCKATNRCVRNSKLINQLKKEVQYGRLIVFTSHAEAIVKIEGFRLKKTNKVTFNGELRPGAYKVTILVGGKAIKEKEILLKPNHSAVIDARPAKIKVIVKKIIVAKKIPPLVLVGYITGGALLLGGAAVAILGYTGQSSLNTCRQNADCSQPKDVYDREFAQAGVFVMIGYIAAATGIVVLGGGVIAHLAVGSGQSTGYPPSIKRSLSLGSFGYRQ